VDRSDYVAGLNHIPKNLVLSCIWPNFQDKPRSVGTSPDLPGTRDQKPGLAERRLEARAMPMTKGRVLGDNDQGQASLRPHRPFPYDQEPGNMGLAHICPIFGF
jgi:hypothetical protein